MSLCHASCQTNGRTNGRKDGRKNGRKDGRKDGGAGGRVEEGKDGMTEGRREGRSGVACRQGDKRTLPGKGIDGSVAWHAVRVSNAPRQRQSGRKTTFRTMSVIYTNTHTYSTQTYRPIHTQHRSERLYIIIEIIYARCRLIILYLPRSVLHYGCGGQNLGE